MSLLEFNRDPSDRQLRQFGVLSLVVLPLVGWLWGADTEILIALATTGVVLVILAWAVPRSLAPLFITLTAVVAPVGWVIGELALMTIYFGMFVPLGLIFRLAGRDVLKLRPDAEAKTYWTAKKQPGDAASYYRQS